MSNVVIKSAAWTRPDQALWSAKNNVRRVPGSDWDSLLRLRPRPHTSDQRALLAHQLSLAALPRENRAFWRCQGHRERGARPEPRDSRVRAWPQTQVRTERARCHRPPPVCSRLGSVSARPWGLCPPCGLCTHKGVFAKSTARSTLHPTCRTQGLERISAARPRASQAPRLHPSPAS